MNDTAASETRDESRARSCSSSDSASTDPEVEERRIIGASIAPYAVDTQWGNVYWLLGKERRVSGWNGSEKWSDFGGSRKYAGETAEYIAAREFHEETLALTPYWEDEDLPRQSYVSIAKSLEAKEYTFKIHTKVGHDAAYVTFVKQIPWRPSLPREFNTAHVQLTSSVISEMSKSFRDHPAVALPEDGRSPIVNQDFLEKQSVRWWSIPQLMRGVDNHSGVLQYKNMRSEVLRSTFRARLKVVLAEFPKDDETTNNSETMTWSGNDERGRSFTKINYTTYQNPESELPEKLLDHEPLSCIECPADRQLGR